MRLTGLRIQFGVGCRCHNGNAEWREHKERGQCQCVYDHGFLHVPPFDSNHEGPAFIERSRNVALEHATLRTDFSSANGFRASKIESPKLKRPSPRNWSVPALRPPDRNRVRDHPSLGSATTPQSSRSRSAPKALERRGIELRRAHGGQRTSNTILNHSFLSFPNAGEEVETSFGTIQAINRPSKVQGGCSL